VLVSAAVKNLVLPLLFAGTVACVPPPARVNVPLTEAPDKSYTVDLPVGWIRDFAQDFGCSSAFLLLDCRWTAPVKTLLVSRDGFTLQTIGITHRPAAQAFPRTRKSVTAGASPSELAELQIAEMKAETQQMAALMVMGNEPATLDTQRMAALIVIENEPATLDGRDGFRVRVSYHTARGLEIHRVTYGVPDKSGYYRIEYVAPKLYYFDATIADFEKVVSSLRIAGGGKVAAK